MTELQNKILNYMKSMSGYSNPEWGFAAIGFRELARELKLRPTSVSNAMRSLYQKGIFHTAYAKDQFDDTTYFLDNRSLCDKLRNKIKSWCRYWHFNVTGVLNDNAGHQNYLEVVRTLDDWHNVDSFENDTLDLEEAWDNVISNINKCSNEQLKKLEKYCTARKD